MTLDTSTLMRFSGIGLPSADLPAPPKALPSDVGALLKNSGGPLLPGLGAGGAPRFPGLPGLGKKK